MRRSSVVRCFHPLTSIFPAHVITLAPPPVVRTSALLRFRLSFRPTLTRCLWRFRGYLAVGGLSAAGGRLAATQHKMHGLFEEGKLVLGSIMVLELCDPEPIPKQMTGEKHTHNSFRASGEVFRSGWRLFCLCLFRGGFFFFLFPFLPKTTLAVRTVDSLLPRLPSHV